MPVRPKKSFIRRNAKRIGIGLAVAGAAVGIARTSPVQRGIARVKTTVAGKRLERMTPKEQIKSPEFVKSGKFIKEMTTANPGLSSFLESALNIEALAELSTDPKAKKLLTGKDPESVKKRTGLTAKITNSYLQALQQFGGPTREGREHAQREVIRVIYATAD
ncbi:MAG: hypothetical protein Q7S92_06460 [Candidatus Diapherotrites archaeon]|nr:hypothetical protein [Candidatus Diapherotrites archaeon]